MIPTSLITPKPDEDLKVITPWWEVLFKYITVVIMAIAVTTIAVQAAKDYPVCLPVVNCSATNPSINSCAVNTTGDVCSKVAKNKLKANSTTKTLFSFQKDAHLHAFLNSACFQFLGHSVFYPWVVFLGAFVLVVANNIWIINPSASLTMKHFVSLVTECYDLVGTKQDIEDNLPKLNDVANNPTEQPNEANTPTSGVHPLLEQQPNDEANTNRTKLTDEDKSKIKSLYDKVQKFRKIHIDKRALSFFYIFQLILQIVFTAVFLGIILTYFSDFQLKFKCTLSDFEEDFPMHYDDIICLRYIVSFYEVTYYIVLVLFILCNVFSLFFVGVMFVMLCAPNKFIKNTMQQNVDQGSTVDRNVDIQRDMAFLCILLKSNQNDIQFDRFLLLISTP